MAQFLRRGFVASEDLSIMDLGDGSLVMEGRVSCAGGIYIDVWKRLEIIQDDGANSLVRTVEYTYNAVVAGLGNIVRYDSPHSDHNQFHHVHRYEPLSGDLRGNVHRVEPQDDWPTLGEMIHEVESWFYDHSDELIRRKVEG